MQINIKAILLACLACLTLYGCQPVPPPDASPIDHDPSSSGFLNTESPSGEENPESTDTTYYTSIADLPNLTPEQIQASLDLQYITLAIDATVHVPQAGACPTYLVSLCHFKKDDILNRVFPGVSEENLQTIYKETDLVSGEYGTGGYEC